MHIGRIQQCENLFSPLFAGEENPLRQADFFAALCGAAPCLRVVGHAGINGMQLFFREKPCAAMLPITDGPSFDPIEVCSLGKTFNDDEKSEERTAA